jgi:hypothetical protein
VIAPGQAQDHDGHDQGVVSAEEPFEDDEKTDRDEVWNRDAQVRFDPNPGRQRLNVCRTVNLDTIRIKLYTRYVSGFRHHSWRD